METVNIQKEISDSGYGSNKSNSQSQRSSGSSKSQSQHSSISSEELGYRRVLDFSTTEFYSGTDQAAQQKPDSLYSSEPERPVKKAQKLKGKRPNIPHGDRPAATHQYTQLQNEEKVAHRTIPEQETDTLQVSNPVPSSTPGQSHDETKILKMAAITRALSCMKQLSEPGEPGVLGDENEPRSSKLGKWQEYFSTYIMEETGTPLEDGFATAVSLEDGVVVHITPHIKKVLGFPKDMWIGRSFIDFVHPKDRIAFANHITSGLSVCITEDEASHQKKSKTVNSDPFFCRLRHYRGLKSFGFGVVDKEVMYSPFKMTMKLKDIHLTQSSSLKDNKDDGSNAKERNTSKSVPGFHLIIVAKKLSSAYQHPEEVLENPVKFFTRHSASCDFGHFDTNGISFLGHLPQDLIGSCILDYYHPKDMNLLKEIYEGVMLHQGKPFRSKPYRFRTFNGTFAMMETDWSCFINPWSWKLEFVIGQHSVVKGPLNPNVFMQRVEASEETLDECKQIKDEIKKLLTETVSRGFSDPMQRQSSRRRKELAALMESLLEPRPNSGNSVNSGSQCSGIFSLEKDSVMLGEISPPYHENHSGSNESSETQLSYSQLNYRENIERFFQSEPKTTRSNDSTEQMEINRSSTDEESKNFPSQGYSSSSNNCWSGSNESGDCENCDMYLTEGLLSRHNQEMEKVMAIQKESKQKSHRQKVKTCLPGLQKCIHCKTTPQGEALQHQGVKRGTNSRWSNDSAKAIKLPHLEPSIAHLQPSSRFITDLNFPSSIALWPPFSISYSSGISTPTTSKPRPSLITTGVSITSSLTPSILFEPKISIRSPSALVSSQVETFGKSVPLYQPKNINSALANVTGTPYLNSNKMFQPPRSHFLVSSSADPRFQTENPMTETVTSPWLEQVSINKNQTLGMCPNELSTVKTTSLVPLARGKGKMEKEVEKPNTHSESSKDIGESCSSSMYSLLKSETTDESMSISFRTHSTSTNEQACDKKPILEVQRPSPSREIGLGGVIPPTKLYFRTIQANLSPEIVLRFQLPVKEISEVLVTDFEALKVLGQQSATVNEQLQNVYAELWSDHRRPHELLEESSSGNESSCEPTTNNSNLMARSKTSKQQCRKYDYGKTATLYEENAPFPVRQLINSV